MEEPIHRRYRQSSLQRSTRRTSSLLLTMVVNILIFYTCFIGRSDRIMIITSYFYLFSVHKFLFAICHLEIFDDYNNRFFLLLLHIRLDNYAENRIISFLFLMFYRRLFFIFSVVTKTTISNPRKPISS